MGPDQRPPSLAAAHPPRNRGLPATAIDRADLVAPPYSSGTAEQPNGVMVTHRNRVANLRRTMPGIRSIKGERATAVLSYFRSCGLRSTLNAPVCSGAAIVMMPPFDLRGIVRALHEYRIIRGHVVSPIVLAAAKHRCSDELNLSVVRPVGKRSIAPCRRLAAASLTRTVGIPDLLIVAPLSCTEIRRISRRETTSICGSAARRSRGPEAPEGLGVGV